MPIALDPRKKPTDVKVHVSTGAGVDITWSDGHHSHYDFPYLRDECPCATCNEERRRKEEALHPPAEAAASSGGTGGSGGGVSGSGAGGIVGSLGPALPIYKPKARAKSARAVGNYALQIEFTDGHSTGIFSFTYLREICPCPACAIEFRGQQEIGDQTSDV